MNTKDYVPRSVWQALSVLHEYVAGGCVGNDDDTNAKISMLRAENARLRHHLHAENVVKKQGSGITGMVLGQRRDLRGSSGESLLSSRSLEDVTIPKFARMVSLGEPSHVPITETSRVISLDKDCITSQAYVAFFPHSPADSPCKISEGRGDLTPPGKQENDAAPLCDQESLSSASEVLNSDALLMPKTISQMPGSRNHSLKSTIMDRTSSNQVNELYPCWEAHDDDGLELMVANGQSSMHNTISSKSGRRSEFTLNRGRSLPAGLDPFKMKRFQCVTINPDSKSRLAWDLVTAFILAYDCVMVPLQMFDLPDHIVYEFVAVFSTCFWSMDMVASACTGVYVDGKLVMDKVKILRRYFFTWFWFDIIIVSLDWATLILSVSGVMDSMRILRLLRFMRLLKLLRLFKLEALFRKHSERSNVGVKIVLIFRFLSYMFGVVMFAHLLACVWYAIGNSDSGGWVSELRHEGFWYSYFSSLHWALTCVHGASDLHPTTVAERAFAVAIICYALFAVIWLQSTMTQMMIQMHTLNKKEVDQIEDLLCFFRERRVTIALSQCIRGAVREEQKTKFLLERNVHLLNMLPKGLLMDLHAEVAAPILVLHPFWSGLRDEVPRAIRQICHEAVHDYIAFRHENLFVNGDACEETTVIDQGVLEYTYWKDHEHVHVGHGQFAAEGALWMKWNNCGDLVSNSSGVLMYKIIAKKFQEVCPSHLHAHVKACHYARKFMERVLQEERTDIMPIL